MFVDNVKLNPNLLTKLLKFLKILILLLKIRQFGIVALVVSRTIVILQLIFGSNAIMHVL